MEDAGLLDAAGAPLSAARVSLGTFARKDGEPGFRFVPTFQMPSLLVFLSSRLHCTCELLARTLGWTEPFGSGFPAPKPLSIGHVVCCKHMPRCEHEVVGCAAAAGPAHFVWLWTAALSSELKITHSVGH